MALNQITSLYRFLFLLVFSIALMILDHRTAVLTPLHKVSSIINLPFQFVLGIPSAGREMIDAYYPDDSLHEKYNDLLEQQLVLEARLQRYDALVAENQRLSRLLAASYRAEDEVLLTEIVEIGLEPFSHRIVINRGAEAGVYLGQPAIAPDGVLGQVSEVGILRSVVTLITDSSHGIPVQIQRSGLRTIVQGEGTSDRVSVPFLPTQADVRKGDILVTSGMGGRFPVGYMVAEVTEIITDANEAFLRINAETTAKIDFAKEVLLLWSGDQNGNAFDPAAR
jgi:rod shape-determining protein MreC